MARQTTILCIDDETLRLRRKLLESNGFRVITAISGAEGLRVLEEEPTVDLVFVDYIMPEMPGDLVVEELKRRHPTLPVIMMSGHPELPEALLERVDAYVRKGQDLEVVLGVIERTLAAKR
jgi:DNA-binding NtrC family response regulator